MGASLVRLEEIADVRLGRQRSPKNHLGDSMRPYLRAANVGWDGLLLGDVKTMNFTDAEMSVYQLRPGDLLLSEASGSPHEVGKPAIWDGEIEGCAFQNTLLRVRPGTAIFPRYLLHFFKCEAASGNFAGRSRGVGIRHLGREALALTTVPLPPVAEQRRIADVLDRADALRAKRREALTLLDDLAQSIFLDTIDDALLDAASTRPLSEVAGIQIGPFGSLLHAEDYIQGGVPLINPMHIVAGTVTQDDAYSVSEQKAAELTRYRLHEGDVVMGRRGEMGRCAVVRDEHVGFLCGTGSLIMRPNPELKAEFLSFVMRSKRMRAVLESASLGATLPNLNQSIVGGLAVPVPAVKHQERFVQRVAGVARQRELTKAQGELVESLFATLQHRAFAGEL